MKSATPGVIFTNILRKLGVPDSTKNNLRQTTPKAKLRRGLGKFSEPL